MTSDNESEIDIDSDLEDEIYARLYYSSASALDVASKEKDSTQRELRLTMEPVASVSAKDAQGRALEHSDEEANSKYHLRTDVHAAKEEQDGVSPSASSESDGDDVSACVPRDEMKDTDETCKRPTSPWSGSESGHDGGVINQSDALMIKHRLSLQNGPLQPKDESDAFASASSSSCSDIEINDYRRYFLSEKRGGPICFNCGQSGHMNRDCPAPNAIPCFLCAGMGHLRSECPNDLCYLCHRLGHISRNCPGTTGGKRNFPSEKNRQCALCELPGHDEGGDSCTVLNWRFYKAKHNYIPLDKEIAKRLKKITCYCYHCSRPSHFGDDCVSNRIFSRYTAFNAYTPKYVKAALVDEKDISRMIDDNAKTKRPKYNANLHDGGGPSRERVDRYSGQYDQKHNHTRANVPHYQSFTVPTASYPPFLPSPGDYARCANSPTGQADPRQVFVFKHGGDSSIIQKKSHPKKGPLYKGGYPPPRSVSCSSKGP